MEEEKAKDEFQVKMDEMQKALSECQKQNQELEEYAKRAKAELENLRKDKDEEINYTMNYANQKIIEKLIDVLDDMERIIKNFKEKDSLDFTALQLMYKRFKNALEAEGLKKIETSGKFDPFDHEAVERVESSKHEDWDVVEVTQNGYKFKSRVIRPAKVKVALHVESKSENPDLNER